MAHGEGWDVPQEIRGGVEFRWWRVTGNRVLVLTLLSESPVWYKGHYLSTGMAPCFGEGCKLCEQRVGAQLRFVVAGAEVTTHRSGLLEVGQTVATELRDLAVNHGGLKGMVIEISKHTFSKRSRMEIRYVSRQEEHWWKEIDVPDIRTALFLGWQKAGFNAPEFEPAPETPAAGPQFRRPRSLVRPAL